MSVEQAHECWRASQRTFEDAEKSRDSALDQYEAVQQLAPSPEPERARPHQTADESGTASIDDGVAETSSCQHKDDADAAHKFYLQAQYAVNDTQSCRDAARKAFEDILFGSQNSQPRLENLLPELLMKILAFSLELSLINVHPKIGRALPSFSRCSTALQLHAFHSPGNNVDLSIQPTKELGPIYDDVLRPFLKQPVSDDFIRAHSAANLGIGHYPLSDEANLSLQHTILLSRWWNKRHFNHFRMKCAQSMVDKLSSLAKRSNIDIWDGTVDVTQEGGMSYWRY